MGKGIAVQLSQCMIVKNEERNIEKALSWGEGVVYEQIVVDTGSTDRTVELAKKMGAKVFHYPWKDDFAAAKNYALQQASGNWIAFLDADEFFSKEDAKRLLEILEKIHPQKSIMVVRTTMMHLETSNNVKATDVHDRIFRNRPNLRYQFRIHEQLDYKGQDNITLFDARNELTIWHTGYGQEVDWEEKGNRNARLLEAEIKEKPKEPILYMYLGDSYHMGGKVKEALRCYRKALWELESGISSDIAKLHSGLQIMMIQIDDGYEENKEEIFKTAKKLESLGWENHPDIDYFIGCWYGKAGKLETAAFHFESALKKIESYRGVELTRMTSDMATPNWVIATEAFNKREFQKTVQFAITALRFDRYVPEALQILLCAFLTEWKPGIDAEVYCNFLFKIYDKNNLKDLLFLYKFVRESGFTQLEEEVKGQIPQETLRYLSK